MPRSPRRGHFPCPAPHRLITCFGGQLDDRRYYKCLNRRANGKPPGPDGIPAEILQAIPADFHDALSLLYRCTGERPARENG